MGGFCGNYDMVGLAYLSCAIRGISRDDFETEMADEYIFLSRMMSPSSLPSRVSASVPIKCIIESISLERTSNRYVVRFIADGQDSPETIRSDRLDGRHGEVARALWSGDLVGRRAIIYKLNENASSGRARGYRVAPYVIPLR